MQHRLSLDTVNTLPSEQTTVAQFSLKLANSTTRNLSKRIFIQGDCSEEQFEFFAAEYSQGIGYAQYVQNLVNKDNAAYKTFFGPPYQTDSAVDIFKNNYLGPFAALSRNTEVSVGISCGNSLPACTQPPENGQLGDITYAVTIDGTDWHLCDAFFEQPPSSVSNEAWCNDDRTLGEFETGGKTQHVVAIFTMAN